MPEVLDWIEFLVLRGTPLTGTERHNLFGWLMDEHLGAQRRKENGSMPR